MKCGRGWVQSSDGWQLCLSTEALGHKPGEVSGYDQTTSALGYDDLAFLSSDPTTRADDHGHVQRAEVAHSTTCEAAGY